jgi:hypothetical protein
MLLVQWKIIEISKEKRTSGPRDINVSWAFSLFCAPLFLIAHPWYAVPVVVVTWQHWPLGHRLVPDPYDSGGDVATVRPSSGVVVVPYRVTILGS